MHFGVEAAPILVMNRPFWLFCPSLPLKTPNTVWYDITSHRLMWWVVIQTSREGERDIGWWEEGREGKKGFFWPTNTNTLSDHVESFLKLIIHSIYPDEIHSWRYIPPLAHHITSYRIASHHIASHNINSRRKRSRGRIVLFDELRPFVLWPDLHP